MYFFAKLQMKGRKFFKAVPGSGAELNLMSTVWGFGSFGTKLTWKTPVLTIRTELATVPLLTMISNSPSPALFTSTSHHAPRAIIVIVIISDLLSVLVIVTLLWNKMSRQKKYRPTKDMRRGVERRSWHISSVSGSFAPSTFRTLKIANDE